MTQILLVFADPGPPAAHDAIPQWGRSIPDANAPEWPWAVTRVRYTVTPPIAAPPVPVTATKPATVDASTIEVIRTWDILATLGGFPLVHICRPQTSAGEIVFLAAKSLGKKIVLSDFEPSTSAIGSSLGLAGLADSLICRTKEEADGLAGYGSVQVLDLGEGGSLLVLGDIYADLLGGAERTG